MNRLSTENDVESFTLLTPSRARVRRVVMKSVVVRAAEPVDVAMVGQVGQAFTGCHTLGDLMSWCAAQSPRAQISEIVTQDEYTHDVVLPFGSAFLSFDTT